MADFLKRQLDFERLKSAAMMALIYCLLYNSSIVLYKFSYLKTVPFNAVLELAKEFFYSYLATCIVFLGLNLTPWILIAGTYLLFITSAAASYYVYLYKITPTYEIVRAAFETNANELYELLNFPLILWFLVCTSVCIYVVRRYVLTTPLSLTMKAVVTLCFLQAMYNISSPYYRSIATYFPTQYLNSSYKYLKLKLGKETSKRKNIADGHEFISNADNDVIGVLIIGEAARSDHFSLGRYPRPTNPLLAQRDDIYFFDARSCSNITFRSVTCMLSDTVASNVEDAIERNSFLATLTSLGFNTTWLGTQSLTKYFHQYTHDNIYDDVEFTMIPGGSALMRMNAHDEKLLPYFANVLAKSGKQFIVLHTSGSHWSYDARYPEEFAVFKPVCQNGSLGNDPRLCARESLINSYDNTILYADHFIHNVIKMLENKNAFVLYASDHGESLGENGRYLHGGDDTEEQYRIPMIFWASNVFIKSRKLDIVKLKQYTERTDLSHDNILHTVFDCLKISSTMIDKSHSLCNTSN